MPIYNHYYPDPSNRVGTDASAAFLAGIGPVVPVTVSVTAAHQLVLQRLNLPIPVPISGWALIDTGASLCMVDEDALKALSIPPLGSMVIATPSGSSPRLTYPASLSFPSTTLPPIAFFDFVSGPLTAQGIVAIIGRNVLRNFVLTYNGPGGQITLCH